jgi:hypothetical protein
MESFSKKLYAYIVKLSPWQMEYAARGRFYSDGAVVDVVR